jgi:hypothetical protein
MAFEKFTKTGARGLAPKASIWSRGQIGFNQSAVAKFQINNYDYVVLFYDKESKRIGIKLTHKNEEGAIKIVKSSTGAAFVSAKEFIFHYNMYVPETRNYDLDVDAETGFIVIDTNKYRKRLRKREV